MNDERKDRLSKKIENLKEYLKLFPKLKGFEEHINFLVNEIEKEVVWVNIIFVLKILIILY